MVHDVKGLLREAQIAIGREYSIELSYHYGMQNFRRVGATIVNLINREYCKKLIVMLPGQSYPRHCHKLKEETFQILYGELELELEGRKTTLRPGDGQLVKRMQYHSFFTRTGCVFEEISTTYVVGDSYYEDEKIPRMDPIQRKTVLDSW
jgi:N-acetylneuraminate synthase